MIQIHIQKKILILYSIAVKEILNKRPSDYDIDKVIKRVSHFSGVVNQMYVFKIQDIIKEMKKTSRFGINKRKEKTKLWTRF